jgi:ribosome maturation factor RimP
VTDVYERERQLQHDVTRTVENGLPGVEVLAVELAGPERFTVYVDHPGGVDHGLCERVTELLRGYLSDFSVDVSSPGLQRPLRRHEHFRNVVGRRVALRTAQRRRVRGEVLAADERAVTVQASGESVDVPYDEIVRGNLIEEEVPK